MLCVKADEGLVCLTYHMSQESCACRDIARRSCGQKIDGLCTPVIGLHGDSYQAGDSCVMDWN